jgi:cytochrome o ubiquinol oxidase subunit 2
MSVISWQATHRLDPYAPLASAVRPLTIQVIAMNWKWLFVYPEQGIATVNYVAIPAKTPITFALTADSAPMNSFWIPQLSGQMYAMPGMTTPLRVIADTTGEYAGRAAEINGEGLAGMTFTVKAVTQADFLDWVSSVKQSAPPLTDEAYKELLKPAADVAPAYYSSVASGLYSGVVMKYMMPMPASGNCRHEMPGCQCTK